MDFSPKSIPEGLFEFHKQDNPRYHTLNSNTTLKRNLMVGTTQGRTSCLSQSRNSLESNGSVYEAESIGETSFGGSFGQDEPDGSIFGGNFRSVAADDVQVVPDFNDILETIHIGMDRSNIQSASFLTDSEASTNTRVLQSENCNNYVQKRRNSERDELEIYFPCVLTPIPVDRLYSTLVDDSTVFKFPVSSDEFLPEDKAGHGLLSQLHDSSNSIRTVEGGHSLESFGNFSVFSYPRGSQVQLSANMFELPTETCSRQDLSDSCILTRTKDYNTSRGGCYEDSGQSDVIEENTLSLSVTTVENNHNLQKSLTNAYCPEAINTGDGNCVSKVLLPHPSYQTSYGTLPFQLNSIQHTGHIVKFSPTLAEVTDVSVSRVSLEETFTNSLFFHDPTKDFLAGSNVEIEGSKATFKHGRAEVLNCSDGTPSEIDLSLYSAQDNICNATSRRAEFKATACPDSESSAFSTRTSGRLKNSRKLKRAKKESHLDGDTRDFHNDMEKQRRTNMKTRFQNLRLTVPELLDNEKASKIVILQKAVQYIRLLEQESIELENIKRAERLRNIELLDKLQKITSGKC